MTVLLDFLNSNAAFMRVKSTLGGLHTEVSNPAPDDKNKLFHQSYSLASSSLLDHFFIFFIDSNIVLRTTTNDKRRTTTNKR
jgi:hypothetical protein